MVTGSTLNCSVIFDLTVRFRLLLKVSSRGFSPDEPPRRLLWLLLLFCLKLSIDGDPYIYLCTVVLHVLAKDEYSRDIAGS